VKENKMNFDMMLEDISFKEFCVKDFRGESHSYATSPDTFSSEGKVTGFVLHEVVKEEYAENGHLIKELKEIAKAPSREALMKLFE
jgi:hypothetical protein